MGSIVADARYGRGNAGTINLVFKSGTNRYQGEVFEFLRNSALDARNYFDTAAKPGFRMNEFGGTFGGPLSRRDNPQTFFFVYLGARLSRTRTVRSACSDDQKHDHHTGALEHSMGQALLQIPPPSSGRMSA